MRLLQQNNPSIELVFPNLVSIADFDLPELVRIIEQHALQRGYTLQHGLHPQLEKLISEVYGSSIHALQTV